MRRLKISNLHQCKSPRSLLKALAIDSLLLKHLSTAILCPNTKKAKEQYSFLLHVISLTSPNSVMLMNRCITFPTVTNFNLIIHQFIVLRLTTLILRRLLS